MDSASPATSHLRRDVSGNRALLVAEKIYVLTATKDRAYRCQHADFLPLAFSKEIRASAGNLCFIITTQAVRLKAEKADIAIEKVGA